MVTELAAWLMLLELELQLQLRLGLRVEMEVATTIISRQAQTLIRGSLRFVCLLGLNLAEVPPWCFYSIFWVGRAFGRKQA